MQQRTGSFKKFFSKNTFYRFLNLAKNWLQFTSLLATDIVNNDIKKLTGEDRKTYSSLMTVFSIALAVKNRTGIQGF